MALQATSQPRQRKIVKRSANFYEKLRNELEEQGPIQVEYSDSTKVNIKGVWNRWER